MNQLYLFGGLCALAPALLAILHPLLGALTRPLVYLLAAGQALLVPVLVALDPNISFGSDSYSLGAGIAIALILFVEFVFLTGTALGLVTAIWIINRRERASAIRQFEATLSLAATDGAPERSSAVTGMDR